MNFYRILNRMLLFLELYKTTLSQYNIRTALSFIVTTFSLLFLFIDLICDVTRKPHHKIIEISITN